MYIIFIRFELSKIKTCHAKLAVSVLIWNKKFKDDFKRYFLFLEDKRDHIFNPETLSCTITRYIEFYQIISCYVFDFRSKNRAEENLSNPNSNDVLYATTANFYAIELFSIARSDLDGIIGPWQIQNQPK